MLAIPRERKRADLDGITMLDWLREKRQTQRAIEPLLESGAGQRGKRRSGPHGRRRMDFRCSGWACSRARMPTSWGFRTCRCASSIGADAWERIGRVAALNGRLPVERVVIEDGRVSGVLARRDRMRRPMLRLCPAFRAVGPGRARRCRSTHRRSRIRRSPASICGSTAPSPICRTRRCSTAPSSGCSISPKAATCNWW